MKTLRVSIFPAFAVFISGTCVMSLQILGSRLMIPTLGATINVWTALISLFLVGIAFGYYLGDIIADKILSFKVLGSLFILVALFVSQISFLNLLVSSYFLETTLPYWIVSLLYTTLLLFIPATIFGTITIYTIRLSLKKSQNVGRINGFLYAISTIGSLFGILGTGFYLIPFLNISTILLILSSTLFLSGIIFLLHGWYIDKILD